MSKKPCEFDVLCLGHASYDLVFSVPHHPAEDEKLFADSLLGCGGGPAANAAVLVAKLGFKSAFAGYLGRDLYGECHLQELQAASVNTQWVVRGESPTPLSAVLVKPDGQRALLNYKGDTIALTAESVDFSTVGSRCVLFDGHEPALSLKLLGQIDRKVTATVLDAGSLHEGTRALMDKVDYLVCSEKFATQYAGEEQTALQQLANIAPVVVVTLGERGLIWQRGQENGRLSAPTLHAVDSTGAGDAFHGAFAAAVAAGMDWPAILRFASAAGAFCCTRLGARPGLPDLGQLETLLAQWQPEGCSK